MMENPEDLDRDTRPEVLGGISVRVQTGCGNMYVQLNWKDGRLFEVFATLGRSGLCSMCYSEALTRVITEGLRCGVPISGYIDQIRGISCPKPIGFPKDKEALSCPDALAKTLSKFGFYTTEKILKVLRGEDQITNPISNEEELKIALEQQTNLRLERDKIDPPEESGEEGDNIGPNRFNQETGQNPEN